MTVASSGKSCDSSTYLAAIAERIASRRPAVPACKRDDLEQLGPARQFGLLRPLAETLNFRIRRLRTFHQRDESVGGAAAVLDQDHAPARIHVRFHFRQGDAAAIGNDRDRRTTLGELGKEPVTSWRSPSPRRLEQEPPGCRQRRCESGWDRPESCLAAGSRPRGPRRSAETRGRSPAGRARPPP